MKRVIDPAEITLSYSVVAEKAVHAEDLSCLGYNAREDWRDNGVVGL